MSDNNIHESEAAKNKLEQEIKVLTEKRANLEQLCSQYQTNIVKLRIQYNEKRKELTKKLQQEYEEKRNILEASLSEVEKDSIKRQGEVLSKLNKYKSEQSDILMKELQQEVSERRKKMYEDLDKYISDTHNKINAKLEECNKKEKELERLQADLDKEKRNCERKEERLSRKEDELKEREAEIDNIVEEKCASEKRHLELQIARQKEEITHLYEQLLYLRQNQDAIKNFEQIYGKSPEDIKTEIKELNIAKDSLEKELSERPTKEVLKERDSLKIKVEKLEADIEKLSQQILTMKDGFSKYKLLENEKNILENSEKYQKIIIEQLQNEVLDLRNKLERLSQPFEAKSTREERIDAIKKDDSEQNFILRPLDNNTKEIDWLNNICCKCDSYGIHFPQRILYAFHTALKIADWASITVLAGASGTGKSELPKLYSYYGGMNFINVPVQPSWDSQESMLGFFNSIDNRFEPEPLLKFLVKCTENEAYNKYVSLVLLDEMNLAHIEHYFASFLSELENRRGKKKNDVPQIQVKLGSGLQPFGIKLARNIIWTGTMNQDETTKSLSDKVLDRGLVINFPRPIRLISRAEMKPLYENNEKNMLPYDVWKNWVRRSIPEEADFKDIIDKTYRPIVEDINKEMSDLGRALGHRVWQAIEYYIANYPTVFDVNNFLNKNEMHRAFEDQIVQKIMPKLRGIETRGKSRDKLDRIKAILENNGFALTDDFNTACEQGHGQFIWCSSKYIDNDEQGKIQIKQ